MTDAERFLWKHLRSRQLGGHKFRRQYVIEPYIVDFICLPKKLIIEIDGSPHMANQFYDIKRSDYLYAKGYRVLRFWNDEVFKEISSIMNVISDALFIEDDFLPILSFPKPSV